MSSNPESYVIVAVIDSYRNVAIDQLCSYGNQTRQLPPILLAKHCKGSYTNDFDSAIREIWGASCSVIERCECLLLFWYFHSKLGHEKTVHDYFSVLGGMLPCSNKCLHCARFRLFRSEDLLFDLRWVLGSTCCCYSVSQ